MAKSLVVALALLVLMAAGWTWARRRPAPGAAAEIRGQRFTGVTFLFPEGNDRDAP